MITAAEIQMIRNFDPGAVLPGIDTMTGNPYATSTLLDVTKITQNSTAPYFYTPSNNSVTVTQAGAVLSGINFGTATVDISANNVTIEDCTFTGTTGYYAVLQTGTSSGATVDNCTFTGTKSPTEGNVWIGSTQGSMTIEDNTFLNSPTDAIDMHGGVVTGNYFSGAGYLPGAHADAIWVPSSTGTTITDNFIDGTTNADSPANQNSDLRLTNEEGNLSNVTVSGNYLLGGAYTVEAGSTNTTYTISNVSIANNYIGFDTDGPYYPTTDTGISETGTTIVDFTNPTPSIEAQAAYQAPTTNVISATSAGATASGSAPTTILGNDLPGAHLFAGAGETNFVPGPDQYLFTGRDANILTYLAMSDGGDTVSSFDPAKDVIDLSNIDANITTPGLQSFTFIGTAAFDGGAEVRYQQDPTTDVTYVQAALAGDISADFTITIEGLVTLTAANFALTPAQSSADLAAGAALTYTKVATATGAPTEYAYSNVQNKTYTSYESFSGSSGLAADDLNRSSSASGSSTTTNQSNTTTDDLVLYAPSMTVTRGGGSESLQIGTGGADPLSYHPVETIDARTSGSEQFIFGAGFGNETINGFEVSGATPDTIDLASSSFSYLTSGMSQAQDLAAVLAQASSSASGLTIVDSDGDSLTLTGVTAAMVAADPSMFDFT
jgi:hypothetical protein